MELYLIRHGIAADSENYATDEERPLTDEGKRKTKKVAQRLYELDLHFDLILTSPLARAGQTSAILQAAQLCDRIEESPELAFDGDIQTWLSWLETWRQDGSDRSLALVGHQPNLGQWAEILVWGEARGNINLKKAGIIGLTLPETTPPIGHSQMFWLAPPKFLL